MILRAALLLALLRLTDCAAGKDPKGAINVDQLTFDSLVKTHDMLVRFDRQHAYGEKEKEFKELCERVGAAGGGGRADFILAYAGVTEYGEKFAHSIAERFGVSKKDTWPAYLYFTKARAHARARSNSPGLGDRSRGRRRATARSPPRGIAAT